MRYRDADYCNPVNQPRIPPSILEAQIKTIKSKKPGGIELLPHRPSARARQEMYKFCLTGLAILGCSMSVGITILQ